MFPAVCVEVISHVDNCYCQLSAGKQGSQLPDVKIAGMEKDDSNSTESIKILCVSAPLDSGPTKPGGSSKLLVKSAAPLQDRAQNQQ